VIEETSLSATIAVNLTRLALSSAIARLSNSALILSWRRRPFFEVMRVECAEILFMYECEGDIGEAGC
jgi:hypothetical protein